MNSLATSVSLLSSCCCFFRLSVPSLFWDAPNLRTLCFAFECSRIRTPNANHSNKQIFGSKILIIVGCDTIDFYRAHWQTTFDVENWLNRFLGVLSIHPINYLWAATCLCLRRAQVFVIDFPPNFRRWKRIKFEPSSLTRTENYHFSWGLSCICGDKNQKQNRF